MRDIIVVKEFNLWFGKDHILKNINMNIEKNKVTAIIGPSGCGKSTFIKSINRMNDLVPNCTTDGEILFDGFDNIYKKDVDVYELRKRIGMVFQNPNPFPMSIKDNITYGPKIHGIKDKKKLNEIVESSLKSAALFDEVKDRLDDMALGLSGGQQQRLCIARALSIHPEIILFDEPCSALDPISTSKIEDLILDLVEKYTIIIVTHNMQQAARISDNTAFFLSGELIEYGNTSDIFETPKDKRTEAYITGKFG
ncbi:MAG: phosphate ABC transporter ATP-binding protein [Candidatus Methanoliparum thermophilum]|uniref:Phosphate ABC transporter ATP-binding protein n=1 Tax=Methanoliparum thermophilum TaxID=2491083 RepID=A0A520KT54_METT2|nr:phosphate ABC transporter ATP-binding protein PstB [Candidatus Methanoliparum sp. LAM-1]RZN65082.1 MAG: phosphate ABC transporter ATP-binding protein [Candidatus Methanoliparum thermophilum]BDC36025.1 phosphate import ATP-binding protein PstB [Candidatus Methanoliparum sp. LAM-1]